MIGNGPIATSGSIASVYEMAVSGSDLYVGGQFTTAGKKIVNDIARVTLGDPPGYQQLHGKLLPEGSVQLSFIGDPASHYALDRALDLAPPVQWVGQQTNIMTVGGVLLFTNAPVPGTNNFWRVRALQ